MRYMTLTVKCETARLFVSKAYAADCAAMLDVAAKPAPRLRAVS